jgi:hypothetical protein
MLFGGGVFGKELGYEYRVIMNGVSALIRTDRREIASSCSVVHHVRTELEDGKLQTTKTSLTRAQPG